MPDGVEVLLVRHGRTAWNAERRFLGITDVPLDAVGHEEAAALGRAHAGRFTAIWSSPLARARATADALRPPDVGIDPDLRELAEGDLEGLDGPEAMARFPAFFAAFTADPTHARPPGGETFAEARDRGMAAVRRIVAEAAPGARIAVVTHQVVIATVICTLRGEPLASWRTYGVPNTGTAALWFDGHTLSIHAANRSGSAGDSRNPT